MSSKQINFVDLLPILVPKLKEEINIYHNLFEHPLIAELWEETLAKSFKKIGYETTWTPRRSHKVGEDMRLKNITNSRISCKSGQFTKSKALNKQCVLISGSRSTKYKSLEDKLAHFSKSHDDYYFLLAKKKPFNKIYTLLVFPSTICCVNQLKWEVSESGKAWDGKGTFIATINKSMSGQLWTTIPLDMIPYKYEINCN